MLFDTGAEISVATPSYARQSKRRFACKSAKSKFRVSTANDESMKVDAYGTITRLGIPAVVTTQVTQDILSGTGMQRTGIGAFIFPLGPSDRPPVIGLLVDVTGEVYGEISEGMVVDSDLIGPTGRFVTLPKIPFLTSTKRVSRISTVYGWKNMPIERMVPMLQISLQCSLTQLVFMSKSIKNFPVDAKEVREHFGEEVCRVKGQITRRSNKTKDQNSDEQPSQR